MTQPNSTACIEISAFGDADTLRPGSRPLPEPQDNEVIIKVCAAGVNRPDIIQRTGHYTPPPGASDILGLEVSGTIIATGPKVTRFSTGDKVCALLTGGGYSEFTLAHENLCLPIPKGISLIDAAAIPETFFTIWYNLIEEAGLSANDIVLIHGGSSGIGTTSIQIAKALGATVYTTAGSDKKCTFCESLGADKAFNYKREDFTIIKQLTQGHGADIILDMVGGDYVQKNIQCAARKGRIISLAFLNGSKVNINLMPVMLKQLILTGSTLRSQPLAIKTQIAEALEKNVWPLLEASLIKPVIHKILPLAQAAEAHRLMESSTHIGKIILHCENSPTSKY